MNPLLESAAAPAQFDAARNGPARRAAATLLVNELYASIQGESTYAGQPCTFVRLTGCPLRCTWCDSEFSFTGGDRLELDDILRRVAALGLPLVEVTGGEPLAQPNCLPLLTALCDAGYEVLLETAGAHDISQVDPRVIRIMDIKCPGSGEHTRNRWDNLRQLGPRDEIKFVIADRADYEFMRDVLREQRLGEQRPVLCSPVCGIKGQPGGLPPAELAAWILADRLPVRLQLQLHKQIWPGRVAGV